MRRNPFSSGLGGSGMNIMVVGLLAGNCVGAYVLMNHMHGLAVPFSESFRVAPKALTYQDFDFHEGNRVADSAPANGHPPNDSLAELDLAPFVTPPAEPIRAAQEAATGMKRFASTEARVQHVNVPVPQFGNSSRPDQEKSAFDAAFDAADPFEPLPLLVDETEPNANPHEADVLSPNPQAQSFGGLALNMGVAEISPQLNGGDSEAPGNIHSEASTLELPALPEPAGDAAPAS